MNNTVTPDNTATPGYAPYQRVALSLLGQAINRCVSAAFLVIRNGYNANKN